MKKNDGNCKMKKELHHRLLLVPIHFYMATKTIKMDGLLTEERAYNKYNVGIMKCDIGNNIVVLSTVLLDNIFICLHLTISSLDSFHLTNIVMVRGSSHSV